jgi:hypothetical protein
MPLLTDFPSLVAPFSWYQCNCPCCGLSVLDIRLHNALECLFDLSAGGFAITSLTRCPAHNQLVGGANQSLHLLGRAADIRPLDRNLYKLAAFALTVPAFEEGGFGLYPDRGIIHVDIRPRCTRWAKLGQTFTDFRKTWIATFPTQPPPDTPSRPPHSSPDPPATWR